MKAHSEKFIQRRRFLMVLPLLVTPFVTMIFWSLGGGKGSLVQAAVLTDHLNASLPEAHFGTREVWDKLSLYEIAERDSARFNEARENDPYFDLITFETQQPGDTSKENENSLILSFPHKEKVPVDPNEEKVNRKLEELYQEINKPQSTSGKTESKQSGVPQTDKQFTDDVDRLEAMMSVMQDTGEPDPEMQQIEGVLDKLLDVQHPERVKERLRTQNDERNASAYAVSPSEEMENISLLKGSRTSVEIDTAMFLQQLAGFSDANGFFGLDDDRLVEKIDPSAIEAVIHDTQQLVAGSTVRIRLINAVEINGKQIPQDQFIYGVCSINGERLQISINGVRNGNSILPVSLSVYDLDGLEGIYIPGAIARDAAKQASDNALQNMQLMSVDPSLGAQATVAGVEAAKGMFSKKAKMIKVTVKAGYHILLKDTSPGANTGRKF